MKKIGLGKRALACVVSAATLLTGTTVLSATTQLSKETASAASYDNYAKLLQYSLYFYDGNMCGDDVDSASAFDWRGDCHTGDEVNGGFHDAGDHVKFGLPAGYTASTLGMGYYEFKDAYDKLGQTEHLKKITNRFAEYFKDCTKLSGDTVTNFCYQIGRGGGGNDHGYWGPAETQESIKGKRDALWTSNGASDIAAEYAAALAVNYLNFGNAEDLKYAKALYEFSTKYNTIATDGPDSFYNSTSYEDDQALAAGWLYLATKDSQYKSKMDTYFTTDNRQWGEVYTPLGWNNVESAAAVLYGEITDQWKWANSYVSKECTNKDTFWFPSWGTWGTARHNTSQQFIAMIVSKHTSNDYSEWCKSQMAMIMGNNSTGKNLIVGFDSNSPKYPHHRTASGHAYDPTDEGTPKWDEANSHVLVGALVGGPSTPDFSSYNDSINDAELNEVALDYNAGFVGAAAALYEKYGTGSLESTIPGVSGQQPTVTTAETKATTTSATTATAATTTNNGGSTGGKVLSATEGSEIGTDGTEYKYVTFNPSGAKTITATFDVTTSDTEASGAWGTWTGSEWLQEDFKVNVSGGKATVTYNVPSNVGSEVKLSVYWPGVSGVSNFVIVADAGSSSIVTTKAPQTTQAPTTTQGGNVSSGKEAQLTIGTEVGTDGKTYKYAEFAPNGAKTATAYFDVSSTDTEASGSWGTWTGEWMQEDFKINISNGKGKVVYAIPSNVGSTIKFSVYWPGADSVDNIRIMLDEPTSELPAVTTTTPGGTPSTGNGVYSLDLHQKITYSNLPATDKMIGWEWSQFNIPQGEKIQKVVLNLSTKYSQLGKWQGAFGSSTTVEPAYWTQTDDMEETMSGKTGSITWNIDAATSAIIQTQYGGELKFGVWWIDCDQFFVESIDVYTDKAGTNPVVTTTTTKTITTTTTTTTAAAVKTTAKTTTTTTKTTTTKTTGATHVVLPDATLVGDVNLDGVLDLTDAILLNKMVAGAVQMNEQQRANADVCTDPGVDTKDAVVLLRFLAHLTASIPAAE